MRGLAIIYRPYMLWEFSGSERRFVNLSKYLRRDYAISFDSIEAYPPLDFSMQTYHKSYTVRLSDNLYMNLIEWLLKGTVKILKLRKKQYSFVYATNNNLYNILLGVVASKLLSVPLIVVVHHLRWVNYFSRREPLALKFEKVYMFFRKEGVNSLGSLARTFGAHVENVFPKMADAVITVSKTVASQLRQLGYHKEVFVDGNGIDESFSRKHVRKKYPKRYDAIYVGRLDEGKGVFDLLRVWSKIVQSFHEAKLTIVGRGTLYSKVETFIENRDLSRNVQLVGSVNDQELRLLFLSSKVFTTLSIIEGWGLSVGEALACGLPVVCYDLPTLREVYGSCNSVRLVELGNIGQATDEIIRLLKQRERPLDKLDHLHSFIHGLSWKEVAYRENNAIRNVVGWAVKR